VGRRTLWQKTEKGWGRINFDFVGAAVPHANLINTGIKKKAIKIKLISNNTWKKELLS
jgi:hypothetical protein